MSSESAHSEIRKCPHQNHIKMMRGSLKFEPFGYKLAANCKKQTHCGGQPVYKMPPA